MKYYVTRDEEGNDIDIWAKQKPHLNSAGFWGGKGSSISRGSTYLRLAKRLGIPVPGPGECIEWEMPEGYYPQAIRAIVGRVPPKRVVPRHANSYRELTDAQLNGLQDWCCQYARPWWATGESIIDAAELLVARAIENGNIKVTAKGDHHGKDNT